MTAKTKTKTDRDMGNKLIAEENSKLFAWLANQAQRIMDERVSYTDLAQQATAALKFPRKDGKGTKTIRPGMVKPHLKPLGIVYTPKRGSAASRNIDGCFALLLDVLRDYLSAPQSEKTRLDAVENVDEIIREFNEA